MRFFAYHKGSYHVTTVCKCKSFYFNYFFFLGGGGGGGVEGWSITKKVLAHLACKRRHISENSLCSQGFAQQK